MAARVCLSAMSLVGRQERQYKLVVVGGGGFIISYSLLLCLNGLVQVLENQL